MKPIPGHSNYYASKDGNIYSIAPPSGRGPKRTSPKLLKPSLSRGYPMVRLGRYGGSHSVHRLILLTFKGAAKGRQSRHLDGNPLNNHIDNLEWGTAKDNAIDRRTHNRDPCETMFAHGEKHPNSKLTEEDVQIIRLLYSQGYKQSSISSSFNVNQSTISRIISRRRWSHT